MTWKDIVSVLILILTMLARGYCSDAPADNPCKTGTEFRQFDFWVGEWNVTMNGKQAGTSSVQLILNDCVLLENWTGARGYTGKSFNLYNVNTKKWEQHWVDSGGTSIDFVGDFKDDRLAFRSEALHADGTKELGRLTFYKLPDGNVRQFWEQSKDDGKTWTVAFDGLYTPRK